MDGEWTDLYHQLSEAARSFDMGMSALIMRTPAGSSIVYGLAEEAAPFLLASGSQFFKKVLFLRAAPTIILDTRKSYLAKDPLVISGPCLGCYMEATLQDTDGRIIGALILADSRARDEFSDECYRRFEDHARRLQKDAYAFRKGLERLDETERCCQKACNGVAFLRDHMSRMPAECGAAWYDQAAKQNPTQDCGSLLSAGRSHAGKRGRKSEEDPHGQRSH
eukprot:TRINITY_DN9125_c0_g1_i1.p1 TRINITY_DN9125_c0_g1~~TRINITY_DN9125_c0_g1_i1.p1  ORF type:complete len:222 (+),score=40.30 TRINITY_DN9125_c0_g1_i1:51-716(+)